MPTSNSVAYRRAYYRLNRNRIRAAARLWYQENKRKAATTSRAWVSKNRNRVRRNLKLWVARNQDYLKAYRKIWRDSNVERMKAHRAKWAKQNPEKNAKAKRKWQDRNSAYHNLYGKFWRRLNPEKGSDYVSRRRARIAKNGIRLEGVSELYAFIRESVRIKCFYCNRYIAGKLAHMDHIVPIARGGKHCVQNLRASCPACNLQKSDKLVSEWRPELTNLV